jgi:NDP-sugar pyrophosphorylase family protein
MQIVIVAGGQGSRLGTLTANLPKILLPVAGRPFLDIVLDQLAAQHVTSVHMCLGHHANQVLNHLRRRGGGPPVTTSTEPTALGTAGCLRYALPFLEDRFVLLLGDTYTPVSYSDIARAHARSGRPALMVVLRNRDSLETSNVSVRGGLVVAYDKTVSPGTYDHVDYGVAAVDRSLVAALPADRFVDLAEVFQPLITAGQLAAHEVRSRFWEIGSHRGYAELDARVRTSGLPDGSEVVPA